MSLDSYLIIILLLLHIINIINSLILLKDSEFKGGFLLIIFGLIILLGIQINDFVFTDISSVETKVLSPLEFISFIGSIVLFFILMSFIFTRKIENSKTQKDAYYYKYTEHFYQPKITEGNHNSFQKAQSIENQISKKDIQSKPDTRSPQITTGNNLEAKPHNETPSSIKEIQSNGKAVVAKFIQKEEPLSESEKLKSELKKIKFQRDKLVSIISHDLRTPLNSVFGYCQLLKEGQYKNQNEVKQFAENIFELSKQQLNALNKILEWTKYESSSLQLNPTEFDVTSTINFVAKSMSKITERKNIKIVINSKPGMFVYGDEFMIIEVLKNLLDNAIKFSYPDSSIEIHSHYHEKLNKLIILVVDSGVGIDRDILINLLVSTKKFTTRGTKGEKGLGLGLLIVKAILDKHGENFWIASEYEKWTRVYFTLKPTKIHSN